MEANGPLSHRGGWAWTLAPKAKSHLVTRFKLPFGYPRALGKFTPTKAAPVLPHLVGCLGQHRCPSKEAPTPGGQPCPPAHPQQSQPNHNKRAHEAHTGDTTGAPDWWPGGLCHWAPQDTFYIGPLFQDQETEPIYVINRNKHRELGKMRRQRNTFQTKEQDETSEKE